MTTKQLLKDYVRLRDEIATHGPSLERRILRRGFNEILRSYRVEQLYARVKAETGVVIEYLESDRPLTAVDARNLTATSAVNKEITQLLREWRHGRKRAGRVAKKSAAED